MSVRIVCLKGSAVSGGVTYPIFIGFSNAQSLTAIAEAPSFNDQTSHDQIATNVLSPPVRDWQRPINQERVRQISAVYNTPGELMPNPVLLCENTTNIPSAIQITQVSNNGIPLDLWNIEIPDQPANAGRSLWILDGQHRISGVAQSAQSTNALPVVLLLNHGHNSYSPATLAKIFAQVTTEATKLADLHNEWLTYAFRLSVYSNSIPTGSSAQKAMEAVSELCKRPNAGSPSVNNPFHNRIRFNDYLQNAGPHGGGFKYNCADLKHLIYQYYYNAANPFGTYITPIELGNELVNAYNALLSCVRAPHSESVFFGDAAHEEKIMQDAFFAGVLAAICKRGPGQNWNDLLTNKLSFTTTDWNFKSWVVSLNGQAQKLSRDLAISILSTAFRDEALPTNTGNLADYFKGNDAEIEIIASQLTTTGRPSRNNAVNHYVKGGNRRTINLQGSPHVRFRISTRNTGKIEIIDAQSPPGHPVTYSPAGFRIDQGEHRNPLKLVIKMHHYGNTHSSAHIDLSW
jgi:hypothetical protein